jgi:hypothetical protein
MKQTIAGLIVFLVVVIFPSEAMAVVFPNIRVKPTATPVVQLQKAVDLQQFELVPSNTPVPTKILLPIRPNVTFSLVNTVTPAKAVTPTEESTLSPTLQPTIDLSPTAALTVINDGDQDNLTIWFLAATIGLLLIIVVAQAWPKKDEDN